VTGGLLLVGGHVGDMEFTAGHVARLHSRQGDEVVLLHLTAGEGGHPGKDRGTYRAQKLAEAAAAADRLGARCRVLSHPDGELSPTADVAAEVADVLRETRPATVVTHWRGSLHSDHANCHFLVEKALALVAADGANGQAPALLFAENWEDADGFRPDLLVDISSAVDDWLAAAREHELFRGGVVPFDYEGYYDSLTRMRGRLAGAPRAAAFMRPARRLPVLARLNGQLPAAEPSGPAGRPGGRRPG
jgi:LmbE family N-acetylglucosaminyl deacetylase